MKIFIYTNNAPRHLKLIEQAAEAFDDVFVLQECTTLFPGQVDGHYRGSHIMDKYFSSVLQAEKKVFGEARFSPKTVKLLSVAYGDVEFLNPSIVKEALAADVCIAFGASYLRGPLLEELISKKTINIHMGVSPYYWGHSSNFWALNDRRPDLVGATLHHLSGSWELGSVLQHVFPRARVCDAFEFGMRAVEAAQNAVISGIRAGGLLQATPVAQDVTLNLRHTTAKDFTDEVAQRYLDNCMSAHEVERGAKKRDASNFINPYVF
jgi:hypothetical protein